MSPLSGIFQIFLSCDFIIPVYYFCHVGSLHNCIGNYVNSPFLASEQRSLKIRNLNNREKLQEGRGCD